MFALSSEYLLFVSAKLSRLVVPSNPMWGDWLRAEVKGGLPDAWHRRLTPHAFIWLRVSVSAAIERGIIRGDDAEAAWAILETIRSEGLETGQLTPEAIAGDSLLPGDWHWWSGCPGEAADWASGTLQHPAGPIPRRTDRRPADAKPETPARPADRRDADLFSALD